MIAFLFLEYDEGDTRFFICAASIRLPEVVGSLCQSRQIQGILQNMAAKNARRIFIPNRMSKQLAQILND